MLRFILLPFLALFSATSAFAQLDTDYFSPLSSGVYVQKIAELKARKVPVVYTNKKEQSSYAEIITKRNESLLSDFQDDEIIQDTLLLNKCKGILSRLKAANKQYPFDNIEVFISRSPVPNASCHGEGTLYVNLGLFLWVDNDDELALVIGHELSHQFLDHVESKIKKNIALLSSNEFINEMKAIKKSTDGKYERFKNLLKDLVTNNGTHSRYKEKEADSLGVVLAKNAGYDVNKGALILLKLNNVDNLFASSDIYNLQATFEKSGVQDILPKKNKKYNGLSTVSVSMNADKDFDSVKTHPDCIERYKGVLVNNAGTEQTTNCCKVISSSLNNYKERALVEMIRYLYENERYTLCIHFCIFAMQNGYSSPFYTAYIANSFSGIYAADKKLEKFSVTDAKARNGSTLKELQDMIFNCNGTTISSLATYFLSTVSATSEDYKFSKMEYDIDVKGGDAASLHKNFATQFPHSKYNYLFKNKTK